MVRKIHFWFAKKLSNDKESNEVEKVARGNSGVSFFYSLDKYPSETMCTNLVLLWDGLCHLPRLFLGCKILQFCHWGLLFWIRLISCSPQLIAPLLQPPTPQVFFHTVLLLTICSLPKPWSSEDHFCTSDLFLFQVYLTRIYWARLPYP